MKPNKIFSLAVLAVMMAACSSDIAPEQQGSRAIPFTATLSAGTATTRAIDEESGKLVTYWEKEEQVALIHNGVMDVMEVTDVDDETGAATISGSLTGEPKDGDEVTVIYPASAVDKEKLDVKADLLKEQNGDLETIAEKLDLRKSDGAKLYVAGGIASLKGIVSLTNQLAIVLFSLKEDKSQASLDHATQLIIKDGSDNVLTTASHSDGDGSTFCIAMAPAKDATFSFVAVNDGKTYTYTKSGVTLEAGKYYNSTLKMTLQPQTMAVSATGYSGTYDKTAHGITVSVTNPASGAVVKYGTEAGQYTLDASPTYTDAGKHTVYYQVTCEGYTTVTGSADVEIAKAAGSIKFKDASVTKTVGDAAFTNTLTNTGDGTVKYSTTATNVTVNEKTGEVTIIGAGTATITATVTDGTNYTYADDVKTATYTLTVNPKPDQPMTVSATGYSGTYDKTAHGITVSVTNPASGAVVKYGTEAGQYTLDASPTYTNAGNYTVYYQVTKEGYTTVTGSAVVSIAQAAGSIKFKDATITKTVGDDKFFNELTNTGDGAVKYSTTATNVTVNEKTGEVTIIGTGTATITATVTDGTNYSYATKTATYTLTVKAAKVPDPTVNPSGDYEDGGDPLS